MYMSWIKSFKDVPPHIIMARDQIQQKMDQAETLRAEAYHAALSIESQMRALHGDQAVEAARATPVTPIATQELDITRPVMTRDGVRVNKIERLDVPADTDEGPQVVFMGALHGEDYFWYSDGRFLNSGEESKTDLVYVP